MSNLKDFTKEKRVKYIFQRMKAIYGGQWLNQWRGVNERTMEIEWIEQLGDYLNDEWVMDYAIHHLSPDWPPNAIAFRKLCLDAGHMRSNKKKQALEEPLSERNATNKDIALAQMETIKKLLANWSKNGKKSL